MTELIIIRNTNDSEELKKFLDQKQIDYEIYKQNEDRGGSIHKKKWLADYEKQANDPVENQEIVEWENLESEGWDD